MCLSITIMFSVGAGRWRGRFILLCRVSHCFVLYLLINKKSANFILFIIILLLSPLYHLRTPFLFFCFFGSRNPPVWRTSSKYLSEKIAKDIASKVQMKRDTLNHES